MAALTFRLENFEGPLDLLLALVAKHRMDLHDIPIMELIDQYTAVIATMQREQLDVASEFIEMAARLVEMKSYLLLPRSTEGERMKQELTGQLIEYDACRSLAAQLAGRSAGRYMAVRSPAALPPDHTYTLRHSPAELVAAWQALAGRAAQKQPPRAEQFRPLVAAPFVSVPSRVVYVLRGLMRGRFCRLGQLFCKQDSRSATVATFLAVLELVHGGRLQIQSGGGLTLHSRPKRRGGPREDNKQ